MLLVALSEADVAVEVITTSVILSY